MFDFKNQLINEQAAEIASLKRQIEHLKKNTAKDESSLCERLQRH